MLRSRCSESAQLKGLRSDCGRQVVHITTQVGSGNLDRVLAAASKAGGVRG